MTSRGVEDEAYLNQIADRVCQYGLRGVALAGLEAGRPLSFIIGQLVWIIQPVMSLVIGADVIKKTALLLEDDKAVDHLIYLLESKNKA